MENLQKFSWDWFKRSGHPAAYVEYARSKPARPDNQNNKNEYF